MQEWLRFLPLVLRISIVAQVFAIGAASTWQDSTYLFRNPRLLLRSILARNVVAPLAAILLIKAFSLPPPVALTLAVLSFTPVPPLLLRLHLTSGASTRYPLGLLVSQALLAIVLVPATVQFMAWAFGRRATYGFGQAALLVVQSILAPLVAGMIAARYLPALTKIVRLLLMAGAIILIAGVIPILVISWSTIATLAGTQTLVAFAVFMAIGTTAGHLLGGPAEPDRTTLALATSSRHSALAIAVAIANFPDQRRSVAAAIVIYLILRALLNIPYLRWRGPLRVQPESVTRAAGSGAAAAT
ncbi:MAG TPA: hypothetical protein VMH28_01030 [Candidatus Acidoferrales bacterium]|nr:hypothetical protein [Candidatus Acidoferrales bacterium]